MPNKNNCKFIKLDITKFYPSITENLFMKSFNFAKEHVNIDDDTTNIIKELLCGTEF